MPDYDALLENFKDQFEAFNAAILDTPLTDKEWNHSCILTIAAQTEHIVDILLHKQKTKDASFTLSWNAYNAINTSCAESVLLPAGF